MKKIGNVIYRLKTTQKVYVPVGLTIFLCLCLGFNQGMPVSTRKTAFLSNTDTSISAAIQLQLAKHNQLQYPQSVKRLYKQNGYKLLWVAPDTIKTHASEAMLLLDCVLQYGLNYADYHPHGLTYEKLNLLATRFSKQTNFDKASFDIMLSGVLVAYINHLHYGKLNPFFSPNKIDNGDVPGFDAVTVLNKAVKQKNGEFTNTILSAQPHDQAYKKLQYHLHLLAGLYTGDCYDIPDSSIKKMAVNLERVRWVNNTFKTYMELNIPSSMLTFYTPDTAYRFKVVVPKAGPASQMPVSKSVISYFTTTAGKIVLHFSGVPNVYLPANPEQQLLTKPERVYNPGSISVQKAEKLAGLILKYEGATNKQALRGRATNYQNKTFNLKKPLPIIVAYRTCAVDGGTLISYPDIYNLDKTLEKALYKTTKPITRK